MEHPRHDGDEQPRDRLNYLRLELAQLRERIERAALERRYVDLPFEGVERRKKAA